MHVVLVVYDGVIAEECDAFRSVFAELPDTRVTNVGAARGHVRGPGGSQAVQATFAEVPGPGVPGPDVLVVPGGIGSRRAADHPAVRDWLVSVAPTCRWIVASSTGSVLLAAAGLLQGVPAATHWLAADLLGEYGVELSRDRIHTSGNRITCEGRVSAMTVAYTVAERCAGRDTVDALRRRLMPPAPAPRRRSRVIELVATNGTSRARRRPPRSGDGRPG